MSNLDPFTTPVTLAQVESVCNIPVNGGPGLVITTPSVLPSDIPPEYVDAINDAIIATPGGGGGGAVVTVDDITRVDDHTLEVELPVPLGIINWELELPIVPELYDFFMTVELTGVPITVAMFFENTGADIFADFGDGVYVAHPPALNNTCVVVIPAGSTVTRVRGMGVTSCRLVNQYTAESGVLGTVRTMNVHKAETVTSLERFCEAQYALESASLPRLPVCATLLRAFDQCMNMVRGPRIDPGVPCDMTLLFRSCYRLRCVPYIDTTQATSTLAMFDFATDLVQPSSLPLGGGSDKDRLLAAGGSVFSAATGSECESFVSDAFILFNSGSDWTARTEGWHGTSSTAFPTTTLDYPGPWPPVFSALTPGWGGPPLPVGPPVVDLETDGVAIQWRYLILEGPPRVELVVHRPFSAALPVKTGLVNRQDLPTPDCSWKLI